MNRIVSKVAASLFVAVHICIMTFLALPADTRWISEIRSVVSPYVLAIGLNETWNTFAPNPKSAEQFMKAIVLTLRGKTEVYSLPRMEDLSYSDRYRMERYRKFAESVVCKDCSGLWPDVARYIARQSGTPMDPPDRVVLVNFQSPIDPMRGLVGDDAHATPTTLGELSVQPEDLQ